MNEGMPQCATGKRCTTGADCTSGICRLDCTDNTVAACSHIYD